MAKVIGLPKLSPTMDEGTLVRWAKKEGDAIEIDDLVAEVETDKATMEFRSFDRGVLLKQLVPEGTTLSPDQPMMILGEKGEDIGGLLSQTTSTSAEKSAPSAQGASATASTKEKAAETTDESAEARSEGERRTGDRVLASPLVRKLAREGSVDLSAVSGTGPHGRIIKRDFDAFVSAGGIAKSAQTTASRGSRTEKLSSMRKTIARRLTESKREIPHFYLNIDVDAGAIVAARADINAGLEASGEKVSVNDLLIKACAAAIRRVPAVNASFMGDAIAFHERVDISVAVAIPDGLVTPVIRNADQKGVLAIAREVRELAGRAKQKKLKPEEMQDGTFSISNLGMYGIDSFSAVINPPEAVILAVGAVRDEPVIKGGQVVPGKRLAMTLSCDHRVVDGAVGAEFLKALREIVEKPVLLAV